MKHFMASRTRNENRIEFG